MKRIRLDAALATRLRQTAPVRGVSESALIRRAAGERRDALLRHRLDARLSDVGRIIQSDGERARTTRQAFVLTLRPRRPES